jgi:hypothetical protein
LNCLAPTGSSMYEVLDIAKDAFDLGTILCLVAFFLY